MEKRLDLELQEGGQEISQKIDVIHNKLSAWKKEPEEQEPIRSSYLTSLYAVIVD
jgi:hypothetical protein